MDSMKIESMEWESQIDWEFLPDLPLIEIFSYLPMDEKLKAALVCKNWHRIFKSSPIWHELIITDKQFSLDVDYRAVLKLRLQLENTGYRVKTIVIKFEQRNDDILVAVLYDLLQFFNMLKLYNVSYRFKHFKLYNLSSPYIIPVESFNSLIYLISSALNLTTFEMINFLLFEDEMYYVIQQLGNSSRRTLKTLRLMNTSICQIDRIPLSLFPYLEEFHVDQSEVTLELINEILYSTQLKEFHIITSSPELDALIQAKSVGKYYFQLVVRELMIKLKLYWDWIISVEYSISRTTNINYICSKFDVMDAHDPDISNSNVLYYYYDKAIELYYDSRLINILNDKKLLSLRPSLEFLTLVIITETPVEIRKEDVCIIVDALKHLNLLKIAKLVLFKRYKAITKKFNRKYSRKIAKPEMIEFKF